MIRIQSPATRMAERNYIYDVIMRLFLGQSYEVQYEDRADLVLTLNHSSSGKLTMVDDFLGCSEEQWLRRESLPAQPLQWVYTAGEPMPVLYGATTDLVSTGCRRDQQGINVCVDIFGSCFFMLTRYEEWVKTDRDVHGRFPVKASLAYQEGFLHRPIVNEYAEWLWHKLKLLWPSLERPRRQSRRMLSHDVDFAYYHDRRTSYRIVKDSAAELLRRKDIASGWKKAQMLFPSKNQLRKDPFNTFDWLMDRSEELGLRSSFYMMAEVVNPQWDGNYSIFEPKVRSLMRRIHRRGHEIGFHPTYDTMDDPQLFVKQFAMLKHVANEEGIVQKHWGGRQHFLRWRAKDSWKVWDEAGLDYDSSLAYPEMIGFRSGSCYEYPVFQLSLGRSLHLKERPLIVMDQSMLESKYMDLSITEAAYEVQQCYEQCMRYDGDFTMLWHNSQLVRPEHRHLYECCMDLFSSAYSSNERGLMSI